MLEQFITKEKELYNTLGATKYVLSKLNSKVKGYWVVVALFVGIFVF